MKKLISLFLIISFALVGCTPEVPSVTNPAAADLPPETSENSESSVTGVSIKDAEIMVWTWMNERQVYTITNFGWQEPETRTVHDWTRIQTQDTSRYIYRTYRDTGKSLRAAETLISSFEETADSKLWTSALVKVFGSDSPPVRRWENRTDMAAVAKYLNQKIAEKLSRCKSARGPLGLAQAETTGIERSGNLLMQSRYLFYADRWLGSVRSSLEISWDDLAIVGVVTLIENGNLVSELDYADALPDLLETYLTAGSAAGFRLEDAEKPADLSRIFNFGQACQRAYQVLKIPEISPDDQQTQTQDNEASERIQEFLVTAPEGLQVEPIHGLVL